MDSTKTCYVMSFGEKPLSPRNIAATQAMNDEPGIESTLYFDKLSPSTLADTFASTISTGCFYHCLVILPSTDFVRTVSQSSS